MDHFLTNHCGHGAVQAFLKDIAGLVLDFQNKANIAIKQGVNFWIS